MPRGTVIDLELALKIFSRDAFLRGADHMNREEPLTERRVRVMEYSSGRHGILIAAINALIQMSWFARFTFCVKGPNPSRAATFSNANKAVRPPNLLQAFDAELFRLESLQFV